MEGFDIEEIKEELKTMSDDEKIEYLEDIISELDNAKEEIEDIIDEINNQQNDLDKAFCKSVFATISNHLSENGIPSEKAAVKKDNNGNEYVRFSFRDKLYRLSLSKFKNDCSLQLEPDTFIVSNEKRLQIVKLVADAAGLKLTEENIGYCIATDKEHCTEHIINIISVE